MESVHRNKLNNLLKLYPCYIPGEEKKWLLEEKPPSQWEQEVLLRHMKQKFTKGKYTDRELISLLSRKNKSLTKASLNRMEKYFFQCKDIFEPKSFDFFRAWFRGT